MSLVATLICRPGAGLVTSALAGSARKAVGATGLDWLSPGDALDLALPAGASATGMEEALRSVVDGAPVDIAVQPVAGRRKSILVADMDSTMIDQECIDELAEEAGVKDHVASITARSMNGEIAFEPALRERVALLKGLPVSIVDKVIAERITLASGGRSLVATMRRNGGWTALVSGGFTAFTGRIGEMLGFDETIANTLLHDGTILSGLVAEPILGRQAKAASLLAIAGRRGVSPADVVAVGDGANDLDMLGLAGAGVALHAKPSVAAAARIRIDHGDLTALLFLQGYRLGEFAE